MNTAEQLPPLPPALLASDCDADQPVWDIDQLQAYATQAVEVYVAALFRCCRHLAAENERLREAHAQPAQPAQQPGAVPDAIAAAIKHAAAVLESGAGPQARKATAGGIRAALREALAQRNQSHSPEYDRGFSDGWDRGHAHGISQQPLTQPEKQRLWNDATYNNRSSTTDAAMEYGSAIEAAHGVRGEK